jgi:formylmethanofuran dehydrogenase subunit E
MKNKIILLSILILLVSSVSSCSFENKMATEWYCPDWAAHAQYNKPVNVLDTESALGRYAQKTKEISLKDIALIHGHLCDGLVISYIEIKAVLEKLFPNGIIDRTDLRVVSKNGPCWVDTASMMTGARINFGTLSIDPKIGDGFIIQRISTGEAYDVHLKKGIFSEKQAQLENKIRTLRKQGKEVSPEDIDKAETMANNLSKTLLNSAPDKILDIKPLKDYKFDLKFSTGKRGDIINKFAGRV